MATVVVGGQIGSEGKGLIVGHIAGSYRVHVRVGAANAGHTLYVNGEKHVVQQLPCAAYANPFAQLVLGAGAIISSEILRREIVANVKWREKNNVPPLRLLIDKRAHVITDEHVQMEQKYNLEQTIGSTSSIAREGIGAAQACRVSRTKYETIEQAKTRVLIDLERWVGIGNTVELLHSAEMMHTRILLEGTQGTGLDNVLGVEYPYVTSRHVTAAGIAADCGLGPRHIQSVVIVVRTFPIRVAGPSGPFYHDSKEISWSDIGVDEQKEKTTVTKKIRRVATFSYEQLRYAVRVNGATEIALNFADYVAPEVYGAAGFYSWQDVKKIDGVGPMIGKIEAENFVPVTMIGTGPETVIDRQPPPDLNSSESKPMSVRA